MPALFLARYPILFVVIILFSRIHLHTNTRKLLFLLIAGSLTLSTNTNAQSTSTAVTPTVVTVTDREMPLAETSASVTVLDQEYIRNSHADTAAELLRTVPFLAIAQSGANGGLTTVSIRGGKTNFTLVMIDGIPVNDITNLLGGAFDFSSLPIDNIERVEIVRGPLSSVYGSDAIAGVINFISRKGSKSPVLDITGEFGSFFARQAEIDTAGTWKALQYATGGTFLDVGQQVLDDAYSVGSLDFNGSLNLGPNHVLYFSARWLDDHSEGFPAASGGPDFAILRDPMHDHAEELILGTSFKGQIRRWWIYSLDVDRVGRTEDNSTPAVLNAIPPTYQSLPSSTSDTTFAERVPGPRAASSCQITFHSPSEPASVGKRALQRAISPGSFLKALLLSVPRCSRMRCLSTQPID